jgi:hypothetical protein
MVLVNAPLDDAGWSAVGRSVSAIIWLPSAAAGERARRLRGLGRPLVRTAAELKERLDEYRVELAVPLPASPTPTASRPAVAPTDLGQTKPVRLLCIPDWNNAGSLRVVEAYLRAFGPGDPVTLVVRLEPPTGPVGQRALTEITALASRLGLADDRVPDIMFETSDLSPERRPGLYAAATAFLPCPGANDLHYVQEAMSAGLKVVSELKPDALRTALPSWLARQNHGEALWEDPNRFARPASVELGDPVVVHGYQEFAVTARSIRPLPTDPPLAQKRNLVERYFNREFMAGKSFLDLGANGAFFSFWAAQCGASPVTAVDLDATYVDIVSRVAAHTGLGVRAALAKVQDWEEPADVAFAFALVHWLYSCTANYGSLDGVIGKLASLTRELLVVEWIAPEDRAIKEFNHTQWNADTVTGPYTVDAFETALRRHFGRVEILGETRPTRVVYAAFRGLNQITLGDDLPLIHPRERVLASRTLTEHQGVRYHSRVYAGAQPGTIEKQATGTLALREEGLLRRLEGPHFPRAISARQENGYSVVVMERIAGDLLVSDVPGVAGTPGALARFFDGCLEVLEGLRAAGIRHRDIRPSNIIVRDGAPVLIDFGWAQTDDDPFITPPGLGASSRPPDGTFCDVYSMGCVFETMLPRGTRLFAPLVDAMKAPTGVRVTDLSALRATLRGVTKLLPATWDVAPSFPVTRW